MLMLDDDTRSRLIDARPSLARAGIVHLSVFGSRARGQARADSDIDVLIEILPEKKFSLFDLVGVEQALTEATGLQTNAVMKRSVDTEFAARIAPDIIEIF